MDYEIEEQIKKFVEKHCMCKRDKVVMAKLAVEEANELLEAAQNRGDFPFRDSGEDNEKGEVADVIITALVYAELSGFFDEIDDLVKEKMLVNLEKPARERIGVKVSKAIDDNSKSTDLYVFLKDLYDRLRIYRR